MQDSGDNRFWTEGDKAGVNYFYDDGDQIENMNY